MRKTVVIGYLGSVLDSGFHQERWSKWRPSVSLCQHASLPIARFEMIYAPEHIDIARCVAADIGRVSASTQVQLIPQPVKNPWDFEEIYALLHDFALQYPFRPSEEDYLVHISTGTHVQQICLFLLTESRHFPARLLQSSPMLPKRKSSEGTFQIIDLDLSRYDRIASRFQKETRDAVSLLKSGIDTRNAPFNRMIEQIEHIAIQSRDPILLMGPTGAGKSQLARRIYELKKARHQITGPFVEVNCGTLRGDAVMSALFGHVKGSFTGATKDRPGLLKSAHGGLLFLDEVGELGLDEQAMLLRALEEKRFLPLGGDVETESDFLLICGTNKDLLTAVHEGLFREDLLARINLWTYRLPGLKERAEDIEPNLDYELEQYTRRTGTRVTISAEARQKFLEFARSAEAAWNANFRDLNACVTRMATLASGGRITTEILEPEITRLKTSWRSASANAGEDLLPPLLGIEKAKELDLFDRTQLEFVVRICRESASLSEAGRRLYNVSRTQRRSANDADRLRKYLARYDLEWSDLKE